MAGAACRVRRGADGRALVEQLAEPLGSAAGALHLAPDLAHGRGGAGDEHGVEHERGERAAREAPGDHLAPARPERERDRAEAEQDHGQDHQGADPHARELRLDRVLGQPGEARRCARLGGEGLDEGECPERLRGVGAEVGDTILGEPRPRRSRRPASTGGITTSGTTPTAMRGQARAGRHHHREAAHGREQVAQPEAHRRADQPLQQRHVGQQPGQHVAGAERLENGRIEGEGVSEGALAQVGRHALPEPGHGVEARGGAHRERRDDSACSQCGAVERAGSARESLVDEPAHALPQQQHEPGREQERRRGDRGPPGVGPQQGQQQAKGGEALHALLAPLRFRSSASWTGR